MARFEKTGPSEGPMAVYPKRKRMKHNASERRAEHEDEGSARKRSKVHEGNSKKDADDAREANGT